MKVKTKIYWAPYFVGDKDWTILFEEPQTLFDVLRNDISRDISRFDNVFLCPSVSNLVKKYFQQNFHLIQNIFEKIKMLFQTVNTILI